MHACICDITRERCCSGTFSNNGKVGGLYICIHAAKAINHDHNFIVNSTFDKNNGGGLMFFGQNRTLYLSQVTMLCLVARSWRAEGPRVHYCTYTLNQW